MNQKNVFTTGEVANLLHIHQTTVIDWIDKGLLGSYKTPGGHRRVTRDGLMSFLDGHNMPVPAALRSSNNRQQPVGVEHEHHVHEDFHTNPQAQNQVGSASNQRLQSSGGRPARKQPGKKI